MKELIFYAGKKPEEGTAWAAGYDISTAYEQVIAPHSVAKISSNTALELPETLFAMVKSRSSTYERHQVFVLDGVIDSDYRGTIVIMVHNPTNDYITIPKNARIAQLLIFDRIQVRFFRKDTLSKTLRGGSGFGSTDE